MEDTFNRGRLLIERLSMEDDYLLRDFKTPLSHIPAVLSPEVAPACCVRAAGPGADVAALGVCLADGPSLTVQSWH